jgi:hypothetical protein
LAKGNLHGGRHLQPWKSVPRPFQWPPLILDCTLVQHPPFHVFVCIAKLPSPSLDTDDADGNDNDSDAETSCAQNSRCGCARAANARTDGAE